MKFPVASSLESFRELIVMRRYYTDLFITHLVWRIKLTLYKVPLKDLLNHVGSGFFPSIETPHCMNICISYLIYTRVINSILFSYSIWLVCKSIKVYMLIFLNINISMDSRVFCKLRAEKPICVKHIRYVLTLVND